LRTMSTLEDRILGEKSQYYCSSSEDEGGSDSEEGKGSTARGTMGINRGPDIPETRTWEGSSTNTGPKGVIKDWQRFKQLEIEKREAQEAERLELINKLSLTCQSTLDEEKEKAEEKQLDEEIEGLLKDEFLKEYMHNRMKEMMAKIEELPRFGGVVSLSTGDAFLDAIDKEKKDVTVMIVLYEEKATGCESLVGCLSTLAQDHPHVKFCKIRASTAGLSVHFKISGVPALLVYKGGCLVGNFVRMTDEFGEDFYAGDVESFLIEHGMLPDKTLVPQIIRENSTAQVGEDSGSEFD